MRTVSCGKRPYERNVPSRRRKYKRAQRAAPLREFSKGRRVLLLLLNRQSLELVHQFGNDIKTALPEGCPVDIDASFCE